MKLFAPALIILMHFPSMLLNGGEDAKPLSWISQNQLAWSDYQAKYPGLSGYAASTTSGIVFGYSYSIKNGIRHINFDVESKFYPEDSWVDPEHATDYILKHEQTHFDITELYARILRKRIMDTDFSENIKEEMAAIYNEVEAERKEFQKQFDKETDHSRNPDIEKMWEEKIAVLLAEHEPWKIQ